MVSLLLVHWQLLPLPLLYLSAYFERHRQVYYDLLLGISESGAWRDWLLFFLQGVDEQSRQALAQAKELQDLQLAFRERLTRARGSALLLRLADSLFESPVLTIPGAQRILNVTYHSARLNVNKLVDADILRQTDQTSYGRSFAAGDILRVIGEQVEGRTEL